MELLKTLTSNYLINVGVVAWVTAQLIKTILTFIATDKFVPERLIGSGGMPSAHSSTVCALTVGMARKLGFASPEFALSIILAGVVMYDAMGVRRAAGEQARILNFLMMQRKLAHKDKEKSEDDSDEEIAAIKLEDEKKLEQALMFPVTEEAKKLKEFLGHTPLEVLAGALLGILVAMMFPVK